MIKNVLSSIGGIGVYGVISICLFFAVFCGALIWAWRLRQPVADALASLPLEDGTTRTSAEKGMSHE